MKLDIYHIKKLLGLIGQGMTKEIACTAAGISRSTYYEWCKEGKEHAQEEQDTLQRQLYEALPTAEAQCELQHLKTITKASKKDWHASAWYLERTRPARYAKRTPEPEPRQRDGLVVIG